MDPLVLGALVLLFLVLVWVCWWYVERRRRPQRVLHEACALRPIPVGQGTTTGRYSSSMEDYRHTTPKRNRVSTTVGEVTGTICTTTCIGNTLPPFSETEKSSDGQS